MNKSLINLNCNIGLDVRLYASFSHEIVSVYKIVEGFHVTTCFLFFFVKSLPENPDTK